MFRITPNKPRVLGVFVPRGLPEATLARAGQHQIFLPRAALVRLALAAILVVPSLLVAPRCFAQQGVAQETATLVSAQQVRALTPEQAARRLPVRIQGQVILLSGWKNSFFFSDGKVGISVDRNDLLPELHAGDQVEVEGKTSSGLFAPVIITDQIRVLGKASLPLPPLRDYSQLADSSEDSQSVRVAGVVQAAWIAPSWGKRVLFLDVDMGAGVNITARVTDFTITDPSYLVDAEVIIRGVCGTNFNAARQYVQPRLFVANLEAVEITKPPPLDPFGLPLQSLNSLRRFGPNRELRHRIRVSGTVTYQKLGDGLYLQQNASAMFIQTAQSTPVALGTRIDVVGFGAAGPYSPQLRAARFRVLGPGDATRPLPLPASDIIRTDGDGFVASLYDGRLVKLRGRLLDHVIGSSENSLAMVGNQVLFRAVLPRDADISALRSGSELDLTGVVSIKTDPSGEPRAFVLQIRSLADVSVVRNASWWNRRHTAMVLGVVTVIAIGCMVAVILLRRKVTQQAHVVRRSLELSESARKAQADQQFALDQHASVSMTDAHGTITYVNDRFCSLCKYDRQNLIGQSHRMLNSGYHGEQFFAQLYCTIANGEGWNGEIRNRASDGSFYWVDAAIVPTLDKQGRPEQYISIQTDITERKRAADELNAAQQNFQLALAAGKMGAFELNVQTGDVWTSIEHARIFGYDAPHKNFNRVMFLDHVVAEDRDAVRERIENASDSGEFTFECRIHRLDNVVRWISVDAKNYYNEYCKATRRAGVVQDISDRKLAEAEIQRLNAELEVRVAERTAELTEANQEMEAFTYTAAHDLRAPLRHMHGFVEMLRQTWFARMDEQGRHYLEKIGRSSKEMGVLLDDLLNFSRVSRMQVKPTRVPLNDLMRRIQQELAPDLDGRAVTWQLDDLPPVEGDPSLLHQAFFNVLANAVKYTRKCEAAHIEVGCQHGAGDVTVFVRDNGAGFEMEYVDKLFRVFQRLHRAQDFEGTGIGLAIVRRIVERHGGHVRAEGSPGQGAAFYISLPVKENHNGQVGLHSAGGR